MIQIKHNSEQKTYEVNGKLIYIDSNGNFIAQCELTWQELKAFKEYLNPKPSSSSTICTTLQNAIIEEIKAERIHQQQKHGIQNFTPLEWLPILGEEVGEVNKAVLETYFQYEGIDSTYSEYRKELIQVAATTLQMLECFDRNNHKTKLL